MTELADSIVPALAFTIDATGNVTPEPVSSFSREGIKVPAPNLAQVKSYFHASAKSTGALTLATLKAGESIVITSLVVNVENQSAATAKFVEFIIKTKGEGVFASVGKVAPAMSENLLALTGPLVFAYRAGAEEKVEIEMTTESEVQSRINITYYTTTLSG